MMLILTFKNPPSVSNVIIFNKKKKYISNSLLLHMTKMNKTSIRLTSALYKINFNHFIPFHFLATNNLKSNKQHTNLWSKKETFK